MADCIFCKIVAGEIPAAQVYEDEQFLAFLDINPVNPGHVLLIPKAHYPLMTDLPDEIIKDIYVKANVLMGRIKQAMKADLVVLSVVGLDVPHFHIHLLPRYHTDGLANWWPTKKYGANEMDQVAERIRNTQ